jgi:hypothetical protein
MTDTEEESDRHVKIAEDASRILPVLMDALKAPPVDRQCFIKSLYAVSEFIDAFLGVDASIQLFMLALELDDLDRGCAPGSLLTPQPAHKQGGRRPGTRRKWVSQAHAALALECLFRTRVYERIELAAMPLATPNSKFTSKSLLNWRHDFIAERVDNDFASQLFKNRMNSIRAIVDATDLRKLSKKFLQQAIWWGEATDAT